VVNWTSGETITATLLNARGFQTGDIKIITIITPPSGWLLCDGSAISRTTYVDLFGVISTNYGIGDGSTTFNVPDIRDRFVQGMGVSNAIATSGGTVLKTTTGGPATGNQPNNSTGNPIHNLEGHTHNVTDIRPPYLTLNYIIKT